MIITVLFIIASRTLSLLVVCFFFLVVVFSFGIYRTFLLTIFVTFVKLVLRSSESLHLD